MPIVGHRILALTALVSLATACRDAAAPRTPSEGVAPTVPAPPPAATTADAAIYLASADGGAPTLLTRGYDPAWAPDGRRLAFHRGAGAYGSVYVIDADGGGERRLGDGYQPSWSPDGSRIAVTGPEGITVLRADGSSVTTIVRHGFAAERYRAVSTAVGTPVWSPDGQRIAVMLFDVDHGSSLEILVVNADGSDLRVAVVARAETGGPSKPAWSPDGTRLAYSNWEGGAGLTVHDLRGGAADVRFADPAGVGYVDAPAWSPDGATLAFTIPVPSGGHEIWSMPAAGGSARLLIRDGSSPAWSPDGARIAFVR
ncbi:WD40-like beta Propeller containing protein [Gemmatirosa kalamazoonensis]|uniref:WD40-like beta Propeller containing protein n=1 Tax=Gemmatirosa kalamazoonensis TaxID=861299 RepID=W0RDM0_9BACT|nr:PD40 domain-containing protein [Gemmatirosa kalamazoonensis]AHG88896.1 WD40-like beta Propeller containing protein [Gemmatirosa kalamazoonensis]